MIDAKVDDNLVTINAHELRLLPSRLAVKRIYDIILVNASQSRLFTEFSRTEKNADIVYILSQLTDLFPGVEIKKVDKKYPRLDSCRYCYQHVKCNIHPMGPIGQNMYKASWKLQHDNA